MAGTTREEETWASEYRLHEEEGILEEIWSYGRDEGLYARALGEVHRLENGNTMINWGTEGLLREISPDGRVVWELVLEDNYFFGRVEVVHSVETFFQGL